VGPECSTARVLLVSTEKRITLLMGASQNCHWIERISNKWEDNVEVLSNIEIVEFV
jgi:hypothetical protein